VELGLDAAGALVVGQCYIFSYLINLGPGIFKVVSVVVRSQKAARLQSGACLHAQLGAFNLLFDGLSGFACFGRCHIEACPHGCNGRGQLG
jgi:hypothetical protein